jgi:SAM-dependent methyltransferase
MDTSIDNTEKNEALARLAAIVGRDWQHAKGYYDAAESDLERRWVQLIWPFVVGSDFEVCVDLAAGHGRNTVKLLQQPGCRRVYCVDINIENIEFCRARFADEPRVVCIHNDGVGIPQIPTATVSMFYCFDAMVHFDSDVVRSYLREISRVLDPRRGLSFIHHSNYGRNPGGDVHDNPHWRNFMTADLFKHYAAKEGLTTLKQVLVDWSHDGSNSDCFSLLKKKAA